MDISDAFMEACHGEVFDLLEVFVKNEVAVSQGNEDQLVLEHQAIIEPRFNSSICGLNCSLSPLLSLLLLHTLEQFERFGVVIEGEQSEEECVGGSCVVVGWNHGIEEMLKWDVELLHEFEWFFFAVNR